MDKELLEKLKKDLDIILEQKGVYSDKFDALKKKLLLEMEDKKRKLLADEIAQKDNQIVNEFKKFLLNEIDKLKKTDNQFKDRIVEAINGIKEEVEKLKDIDDKYKEKIVEAVKSVKIEPKIDIASPKVIIPEIKAPEVKIPPIKVPQPRVTVESPKVEISKIEFPEVIEVEGVKDFIKAAVKILKTQNKVSIEGVDKDNPLAVILTDREGRFYEPLVPTARRGGSEVTDLTHGYEIKFQKVDISIIGDNTIVAANSENKIKVLSYFLVANGDVDCKWKSGATDLTGAMPFASKSGIASPVGTPSGGALLVTGINEDLILNLSVGVGVRGHLSYYLAKI